MSLAAVPAARLARPLRFAAVGGATAVLYTLLFAGFDGLGAGAALANAGAYGLAILFQFVGHRRFTFRATGAWPRMAARFLLTNAAGFGLSTALAILLREGAGAGALATGLVVSAVLAGLNWVVMRLWVFRS